MSYPLTRDTFKTFAVESYANAQCLGVDEFKSDFIKLLRVNRMIEQYVRRKDDPYSVRLILNNFIGLLNVFEHKALVRMVMYRTELCYLPIVAAIFEFLSLMPNTTPETEVDIVPDPELLERLKSL
jgi:hypothetical protein